LAEVNGDRSLFAVERSHDLDARRMSASEGDEANALDELIAVVRRRWPIIVSCFVLGIALAIVLSATDRSEYQASSLLLFRDPGFDQQLFGNQVFLPNTDPAHEAATNIELVSLPVVAMKTAAALHMDVSEIRSAVSITGVGQANVARITATDPDPPRAALIANTYAAEFVRFRQQADRAKIAEARKLVQAELQSLSPEQRAGPAGQPLQSREQELSELAALQTGNAEVVQQAAVPASPSGPSAKRNGLLGALAGLLLGLGLAVLADRLDRRIRDASELQELYGVGVLGNVPESQRIAAAERKPLRGGGAAAIGMLRTGLRYFNVDRDLRSLLITSAVPREGKTTIALNLAIAEALAGNRRVVLVDVDLRHPSVAGRLGLPATPGLGDILSRNASVDEAIARVPVPLQVPANGAWRPSFSVVTAGEPAPNPTELVESRAMIDFLSTLSEHFDPIIIDTPPTSLFGDALPLMRLVSGVLIVARVDLTTRDAARQLREQLDSVGARVLGVVQNGTPAKTVEYAHYRYRRYAEAPETNSHAAEEEAAATTPAVRLPEH
jgi:polysaccharide biosynthesis transport protein